ncbi:DUF3486 family protein [Methylocaldum sp.]|uniref:DUF3486 family protein n=1 Tax=Methylocaldum sp. TaxID=1969727 RepID=UPI002D60BA37|nr:DUF3486 family protein [Methylocaldum sp.]HYE35468.1 DUF3486 family protein [Methylocaldum sp.]
MPPRSAVLQLPDPVKAELDRRLLEAGFSGYVALSEWLADQGYEISKSAIHKYGQEFEQRISALKVATEQAKAIAEAAPDEGNAMNEALIRLVQQKAFDVLVNLSDEDKEVNLKDIGIMVARLSNASVKQKQYQAEVQAKAKSAAEKVASVARQGGLSAEAVDTIRREILGIVA